MKSAISKTILLAATALTAGAVATPAFAAEEDGIITVTANRIEQNLQEVATSITVFNQEKLDNNNILTAKDIATFTPGVYAQTRFGNDTTTYTIRGFAQEQRTTATVGTYFAEVVAPRGNGVTQGGDGASPGALFDLENVQVLKGPTGTLFGRNTTGGAVLLVPVKPRDSFEAYVEGTVGNLNRFRVQGVVNLPISDTFRIRIGVDRHKRDGYIKNIGVRPRYDDDMGSIDVMAFRASAVWDITENIENYTIFTYSESKSSGAIPLIKKGFSTPGDACPGSIPDSLCTIPFRLPVAEQMAREAAAGGFWTGTNSNPNGRSYNEEMRIINRTTVDLSDSITLTNIFAYSEYKNDNSVDAFGLNSLVTATGGAVAGSSNPPSAQRDFFSFVPIAVNPDLGLTANQRAIVEELRLNGETGALTWQMGFYYEKNSPKSFTGTISPTAQSCVDINRFQCFNSISGGASNGTLSRYKVWNTTIAAYAQATYEFTEQLALTAGIRFTEDKTRALFSNGRIFFSPATGWAGNTFGCGFVGFVDPATGQPVPADSQQPASPSTPENRASRCLQTARTKSSAPTWVISLEYKPVTDVMVYAKWSRGYRQGSLSPASPPLLEPYGEERVNTYEIGARTSWDGPVRGRFNVTAFYNDFRGQQIQAGINNANFSIQTTAILNAGKSYTQGIEADLLIQPVDWFTLEAAYSYNKTKLKSIDFDSVQAALDPFGLIVRRLSVGGPIPLAVPHAFNATATIKLPVPESAGEVSISGTIVHMSSFRAVADTIDVATLPPGTNAAPTNFGVLPKRTFGNANLTWKNIGGGPIDVVFSVTNITNEKIFTHINEQSTRGFIAYSVDEPRQYMMRVKYRFGALAD